MRKALIILLAISVCFSSCNDRKSEDIFDQLQDEFRFTDANFFYVYGSVLRALMTKVETGDLGAFSESLPTGGDTENLSALVKGIEKIRVFRASNWEKEKEQKYHEKIQKQLEDSGNELLIGSSFGKGKMAMYIHDENSTIDRFQILARLPEGGAGLSEDALGGLGGVLSSWTSEQSLILLEVQGSFNKDDLGKMLIQLNTSLAE